MVNFDFDTVVPRRGTMCVKWDKAEEGELPLWVADMDFKAAPAITEALIERAQQGVYGYVFPLKEYYDATCSWFSRRHNWEIDPAHILYTIGVVPAMNAIVKGLCTPGDKVVIITPVYNCFFTNITNNDCQTVEVPLVRTETSYEIDFDAFEQACAQPDVKLFLLCNPHNPVGRVWTHDELRRLDQICACHNVTIVSDEIHCEIVFPPHVYTPFATVATRPYVVCCSPSKAFNIAGLQAANIVCPDADLRTKIDNALHLTELCTIGVFGAAGLIAAYNHGAPWLDAVTEYIRQNYLYMKSRIEQMPGNMRVLDLQGTYLAWLDVQSLDIPVAWLSDALRHDAKVWFQAGTFYGIHGEGYLRVNLACPRSTLEEALNRLEKFVTNL